MIVSLSLHLKPPVLMPHSEPAKFVETVFWGETLHVQGDALNGPRTALRLISRKCQHWEAAEMALNCLLRTIVVLCNGLFWSVSRSFSLQGWSRFMPCPSRETMSCVSTWKTLKTAPHTPSMVPLEWACSLWILTMMDTLWPWATIRGMQVCSSSTLLRLAFVYACSFFPV